jgi:hypothetical protein
VNKKRSAVRLAALGLVALSAGFLLTTWSGGHHPQRCIDVGIPRSPEAATPEQAFDAYVTQRGGDRKDWARTAHSPAFAIFNATKSTSLHLASVSVGLQARGTWRVDGGCVAAANPGPVPNTNS